MPAPRSATEMATHVALRVGGDEDGLVGRRVFDGVAEQVGEDFLDPAGVGEDAAAASGGWRRGSRATG